MSYIFICSTGDHAGQTLMTWAISRRLSKKGLKIGLFKPFGDNPIYKDGLWVDHDTALLKDAMGLNDLLDRLNPYPTPEKDFSSNNSEDILKNIKSICMELNSGKDILIIVGSNNMFFDNIAQPIPDITLINELNASCILIDRYLKASTSIYSIFSVSSLLKERLKGVIINRVPEETDEDSLDKMVTTLINKGIPITSIIREDLFLSYLNLRVIKHVLDGELLCCEEEMDRLAGGMTVGSAHLKGELGIFKRAYNKIILLEPSIHANEDESTLQKNIAGILLTGNVYPANQMLSVAERAKIPLIVIKRDTFSTLECLEKINSVLSPEDISKVDRFIQLMDKDNSFDKLLKNLDIPG